MSAPVWLLLGRNAGDNAQVRALGAMAGGEAKEFTLSHNLLREAPAAWLGGSLASLRERPDFGTPWPALVIGAGRRNAPAARWIAEQSGARLVWLGRPRAPLDWFALVLATPQYGVPAAPNVLPLTLPLTAETERVAPQRMLALLGGPSWSARITPDYLLRFAKAAAELAEVTRAPLSLATSPRSPAGAAAEMRRLLPGAEIHEWRKGGENPYRRWLSEAREILVSGDSVSLLADAAATGAPVSLLPAPEPGWMRAVRATRPGRRWLSGAGAHGLAAPPPDLAGLHTELRVRGWAERRGALLRLEGAAARMAAERAEAAARLAALPG
ncbi:MAG: ELM1/GtrOC1 family putative glycosyltransferase [Pikeienuella sp.]|uniref:ELM1/GtrOC1 family putative glycosyltransferase n=1 Tax=Pikeienuella sp. TaxID=2831957 RepID=UPI003918C11D